MSGGVRWVALGASFALACSVVTSFDGLTGDGGTCATCGARSDAGPDADSADSAKDTDVAFDATPKPFCASLVPQPKLCADFDVGLFSDQFSIVETTPGATLKSDSAAFRSPKNAFVASLPAGGTDDHAAMTRAFAGTVTTLSYAVDMRVESWTTGKSGVVAVLVLNEGTASQHTMSFYLTDTFAALEEAFGSPAVIVDHMLSVHPQLLGVWTRVQFDVDLANHTCSASLDGVPALASTPIDATWASGTLRAHLGLTFVSGQASPWTVRYDNVVVDWK